MNLDPTTCRSCGARMIFGLTDKGRRMPLDAEPVPDGPWTVDANGNLERASADTPPEERRQSHFVSCPQGRAWSNKGKAR